jgi:hypothetical protein
MNTTDRKTDGDLIALMSYIKRTYDLSDDDLTRLGRFMMAGQNEQLARELEKADNVIRVYESYLTAAKVMQWAEKDVTNRGLGDHAKTRSELLQEVLYS